MTAFDPQPGDWVHILAKVISRPRPENVEVELFSNTDQYPAYVRVDLCTPAEKPVQAEPSIRSIAVVTSEEGPVAFQRRWGGQWYTPGVPRESGGMTWRALNALGDVEVIHHA